MHAGPETTETTDPLNKFMAYATVSKLFSRTLALHFITQNRSLLHKILRLWSFYHQPQVYIIITYVFTFP